jgi:uncharacterized protein YecT (DUF1311 family)
MNDAWEELLAHLRRTASPTEIHLQRDGRTWVARYDDPYQAASATSDDPVAALEELARKVLL